MTRIIPWLLVVLLSVAFARACTTGQELAQQLEAVHDTARVGAAEATASLTAARVFLEVATARRDTISALTRSADSLRKRLRARVAGVTPAPRPELDPVEAAPLWLQRAEGLAAALELADSTIEADSVVIATQARSLADLTLANDTLTAGLLLARSRLARIDTMTPAPRVVVPAQTGLMAFGEGSIGATGDMRAEAGLQWKDLTLAVEQSAGGQSVRLGIRKTLRLF